MREFDGKCTCVAYFSMSRATPQTRNLAVHLIAYETEENKLSEDGLPAVFHVCETLRPHLATLMGKAGFRAILSRAIAVAGAEIPWLAAMQVTPEGSLGGWDKPETQVHSEEFTEGCVLFVAQLLGLLIAFIGDSLTLRLVRDVWPQLSLENLNFITGTSHEEV
ncbi:MAG: hypothetical protein JWL59_4976 [Chthoniobacteraceae bacterium]|nr:hypothetical protein [Chthoniobacteraceae bacterium]